MRGKRGLLLAVVILLVFGIFAFHLCRKSQNDYKVLNRTAGY